MVDIKVGKSNRSSVLSRNDLALWEEKHGEIPMGAFVLLRSGWGKFYTHPDKFLGNFKGESRQVFPGKVQNSQ